jgi:cytochrome c peroxidase
MKLKLQEIISCSFLYLQSIYMPKFRFTSLLLAISIFISIVYFSSFSLQSIPPVKKVTDYHQRHIKSLVAEIYTFDDYVRKMDTTRVPVKELQTKVAQLRRTFKSIEFSIAYLNPELVKDYLNGAPLPWLEKNVNLGSTRIFEPQGLQRLDEIVSDDKECSQNISTIRKLTGDLIKNAVPALEFIQSTNYSDRMLIEALRFDLIRLAALGMSGFDTPGSLNSIEESKVVWSTYDTLLQMYYPVLVEQPSLRDSIQQIINNGYRQLAKTTDFQQFDRLSFIRSGINPLFDKLIRLQTVLRAEFYYEVSSVPQPFNFKSNNIFSTNFLRAEYYTNIPQKYNQDKNIVELGRLLFFDPILSSNHQRSCASCHQPQEAFADGLQKSIAMDFQGTVHRNSPSLINSVYSDRFFWDLRASYLEDQMDHVIVSKEEFNTSYEVIAGKLNQSKMYVDLFKLVYPEQNDENRINKYTITQSMSAYIRSLTALNSPFDQYMTYQTEMISPQVKEGFNLFMGKANCGICHFVPLFNGLVPPYYKENESEVLGVPATSDFKHPVKDQDPGRGAAKVKEAFSIYQNSFKTVTIRNAGVTAPYMHNGVYASLEDVLTFYNKGGGQGMGLDYSNQTLAPDPLHLTPKEMKSIIAFIHSLTDTSGLLGKPTSLPSFESHPEWNTRVIGGVY